MSNNLINKLQQKLAERAAQGNLRTLKNTAGLIDFCSNDYLGLARSEKLRALIQKEEDNYAHLPLGATGSRLLSGNHGLFEELEGIIASYHHGEAALLFNSGYMANVGLLSALPQRGDTVFYDESSHASMKDGLRLSFAKSFSFRHNSVEDLKLKLKHATGQVYVVVESVYSMDGDKAPLQELAQLCEAQGAALIVDEAHAVGLYGPKGEGLTVALGLEKQVFAQIITYGKAMGSHGAAVVGPQLLREFLINYSRAFIYTTGLPTHALLALKCGYTLLPELTPARERVQQLANLLYQKLNKLSGIRCTPENSVILSVFPQQPRQLKMLAAALQKAGFDVRPVFAPTVPTGTERLRVIVHAYNSEEEIDGLVQAIAKGT
ncbi:aminotransferase class I/II-fold pyridoxal phosphate-dependent enzyme [Pontibacter sp. JH31]|uniref:Aminotransferase class I/II-fold pyridoxal phosphate-dependent enzyme n=1 Tax=Pontibacter aquaedesilientis TaxID=2766980 RepID=A0ABR7XFZ9_9BACT|nr:aminotransferase class I/II-fold pyridoxal phosphate-dependent enzyme [Pontibacter aquaedesilientis]MBD1397194.1 aminotransferase class I/II-fold pyridoxal phosphate-dependent enzyme [Pontibacter aquaedesilientis]